MSSTMRFEHQEDETLLMSGETYTSKLVIRLASGKEFLLTANDDKLCVQSFPNSLILSDLGLDRVCVSYENN